MLKKKKKGEDAKTRTCRTGLGKAGQIPIVLACRTALLHTFTSVLVVCAVQIVTVRYCTVPSQALAVMS